MEILTADLKLPRHALAVVELLDGYARDPMGGGHPLAEDVRARLASGLAQRQNAVVLLGFVEDQPAGAAVCFEGYSTFQASPLLNLHDFVIAKPFRGRGLGRALMAGVEAEARRRHCCKITLEVLSNNHLARRLYDSVGFRPYELDPDAGQALFLERKL